MPNDLPSKPLIVLMLIAIGSAVPVLAEPAGDTPWARVTEDDRSIKIETDKLEAVIPKKNPKQWMTGIEKGSFLDKSTGFREAGDGLCIVDWIMEPGSDRAYRDQFPKPGIVIFIEEFGGRPIKVGESFSAAFIVGYFDSIDEIHAVNNRYKGHTALTADTSGWRLVK